LLNFNLDFSTERIKENLVYLVPDQSKPWRCNLPERGDRCPEIKKKNYSQSTYYNKMTAWRSSPSPEANNRQTVGQNE